MSDWGTDFPSSLLAVSSAVAKVEDRGDDIYEVMIELDNGYWRVDVKYTDEDLDQHMETFMIDRNGGILEETR